MSSMKVASFNNVKVYNLTSNKTAPQWLSESQKRKLAKDEDYRKRLELIQDFEMKTASQSIKMTRDKEHIIVTGTYPPVIKCYTVSDLSLKFQRGLTCEVQAFESLSDDFGKLVFLQTDRTLSFHAPYGQHYNIRIPKFGRSLTYGWDTCDLYVSSCGDEVYRLCLETGQFKEPFTLGYNGCNKVAINPGVPQLLACGGESSMCEFWDLRTRKAASKINVSSDRDVEISELKFDTDGLTLGVGTSNGNCILYDIRSSKPIYTKEHQYELPIVNITFHNSSRHVISTDKKIVKIWERDSPNQGKILTNIETSADINDIHIVEDKRGESGLIMIAGEQSRVMTYFVPRLGPAPRWCSFLENLTEELEETSGQTVYEDFKFVTKTEIEEIGASGLIGTPMLRAYMHGFFMEMKLYNKLRAVSKPFEYEEYRRKKIKDKVSLIHHHYHHHHHHYHHYHYHYPRLKKRDKVVLLYKNVYQKLIKPLLKSYLNKTNPMIMMIVMLILTNILIVVLLLCLKETTSRSILIVMSLSLSMVLKRQQLMLRNLGIKMIVMMILVIYMK